MPFGSVWDGVSIGFAIASGFFGTLLGFATVGRWLWRRLVKALAQALAELNEKADHVVTQVTPADYETNPETLAERLDRQDIAKSQRDRWRRLGPEP